MEDTTVTIPDDVDTPGSDLIARSTQDSFIQSSNSHDGERCNKQLRLKDNNQDDNEQISDPQINNDNKITINRQTHMRKIGGLNFYLHEIFGSPTMQDIG